MTLRRMKMSAKKACVGMMSAAMMLTAAPVIPAFAEEAPVTESVAGYEEAYKDEGYRLVWNDEFDGDSLNRDYWNVELRAPGSVNDELQEYVDNDNGNIVVNDGLLTIRTIATKKADAPEGPTNPEVLKSNVFNATYWSPQPVGAGTASVVYESGKAILTVEDPGENAWDVQIQQGGLEIVKGHEYLLTLKASSNVDRDTQISLINPDKSYDWYEGTTVVIGTEEKEISYSFTVNKDSWDNMSLQFNFGKISDKNSVPAVVTLSDISLKDLSVSSNEVDVAKTYDITSGRINTHGKKDFTYGRFEAKLKVPEGKGYWPAFWLMASSEEKYGQWPRCGEIDIMEVIGSTVNTTQGNVRYGSSPSVVDSAKKMTLSEGTFADSWHVFTLDWEPGRMAWYVDGVKFHEESEWYTGMDDESLITYPAPFDQDFYVLFNLAFGGWMGGTPDQAAIDDMDNQAYQVDYVRVYQKSAEEYKEMEDTCKRPEKIVSYREPDVYGNYVTNYLFEGDIDVSTNEDIVKNNWQLYLLPEAEDNTTVENTDGVVKINPGVEGEQNHSVQLRQWGIPLYRGWDYELSFDAWADEARTIKVASKGPDNGYKEYYAEKTIELTTEKQTFTDTFTMNNKTDANASIEFALGNQGSTSPVYISNVKLIYKSGEEIIEDSSKAVRPDGNYIYNGSFDQGDDRLGYWDVEGAEGSVSVTNDNFRRELKAVVTIPEGATEAGPVIVSQGDLEPITQGKYGFSFDAYMEEGSSSDGMTAVVAGVVYTPELTTTSNGYSQVIDVTENLSREQSNVIFVFSKPGTYYLDNVWLAENALIKNGSFAAGMIGYEVYNGGGSKCSYVIDNFNGNDNTFAMTIEDTGTEEFHIQLLQHNVILEKGKTYNFSFRAKSTIERDAKFTLQCNGNLDAHKDVWTHYNEETELVTLTPEWKIYNTTFTMNEETDNNANLSINLGALGERITTKHDVFIDDIVLVEAEAPVNTTKDITSCTVSGLGTKAWTGSAIKPVVTVKDGDTTLKLGTDYKVAYANNKDVGKATVTITGMGDYEGVITKNFLIKKVTLKFRAYVQKKNWMAWTTAGIGTKVDNKNFAGTTDNLRMETIQMQLSGISGSIEYRAYCAKKGWTQWATTADKTTYAGTKGEARRVEMIQLRAKGQVSTLYDMYVRAYSEKFGWLGWAGSNEKAGSQGYAYKLEAFQVQFVPKGTKFDKGTRKCFYDKTKDGANPK